MRFNLKSFFLFVCAFALLACSSGDTDEFRTAVYVNDLDIVSISIDLEDNQDILDVNDVNEQLTVPVIATLGDGSTMPATRFLQWSSSAPQFVSINGSGIAKPVATGLATISVTLGDFSDSIELEASDAELRSIATSFNGTVFICSFDTVPEALGTYEDASVRNISNKVTWSSDATSVATVQANAEGKPTILALRSGEARLTASLELINSLPLLVPIAPGTLSQIDLSPPLVSDLERGKTQTFVATGTYADAVKRNITQASVWTSSNEAILRAEPEKGLFTALLVGTANASTACGGVGRTATASVTVIEPRTLEGIEIRDQNNVVRNLIEKDPTALDFQLRAWLKYSDNTEEEVTSDEDTDWSIRSFTVSDVLTVGNDDNDLDNKGEVALLNGLEGRVVIEVRAEGEVDEITIDVDFDH